MKRILICTDGSSFAQSSYHYGAWLARRLDAEIDVLYVTDIRSQTVAYTGNWSGSIGIDASSELLNQLVDLEHQIAKINHHRAKLLLENAKQFFDNQAIQNVNLIHETGFLVDSFHQFEATADLIILGKRGEAAEFASGHLGANVERIVRSSHKPCLVTSQEFQPIERLLLAYDGSQSCQKMLGFLVDSPVFKGLPLHIVTVVKSGEENMGSEGLEQAKEQVQTAGFDPICSIIDGQPETAITEYVQDNHISLLLMGAYGHSRLRHLVLGSTTMQMLRRCTIPVFLFR